MSTVIHRLWQKSEKYCKWHAEDPVLIDAAAQISRTGHTIKCLPRRDWSYSMETHFAPTEPMGIGFIDSSNLAIEIRKRVMCHITYHVRIFDRTKSRLSSSQALPLKKKHTNFSSKVVQFRSKRQFATEMQLLNIPPHQTPSLSVRKHQSGTESSFHDTNWAL